MSAARGAPMPTAADAACIERWWRELLATGALPAELPPVQGRLIRAVHTGLLPSGPVHVKAMTFPRAKDRLRYLLRALPAVHEARMLAAVAAAGIASPEVVAVRTARRFGLPFRSMLVLRSLPVVPETKVDTERLHDEAVLAQRLLAAGVHHRDLHTENFVRLASGALAVLDLQSARLVGADAGVLPRRLGIAARLVRDRACDLGASLATIVAAGLLRADQVAAATALVERQRRQFAQSRVMRCLGESTEFTVRWGWTGRQFLLRSGLGDGRWWWGGREMREAWLGQRKRQLAGAAPLFRGYLQRWWWLGGGAALFVPTGVDHVRAESERAAAQSAFSSR
jgi:hypothetical protein